jgi:ribonuclease HI
MKLLRMLFKNKIKVYAQVDDHLMPIVNDDGLVPFQYQKKPGSPSYTTARRNLMMIPGVEPIEADDAAVEAVKPPKPRKKATSSAPVTPASEVMPPNTIVVYTDGGASPNPGPTGCGVIMMYGGHTLEIWEYLGRSTNNIAELTAILRALENIKNKNMPIVIYSDSAYAIGVLTGSMRATKNKELIAQIQDEIDKCPHLQLLKVKAHVGIQYNEHVDRLCALARDTKASGSRRSSPDSTTS